MLEHVQAGSAEVETSWSERRRNWLTATSKGTANSIGRKPTNLAGIAKLEKLLARSDNSEVDQVAVDKGNCNIKRLC